MSARCPQPLRPPDRVRAQWRARGKVIGEKGYSQRWARFWERVVITLRDRGDWRDEYLPLVEEYVRRCRLAELHHHEAAANPYPVNPDSGMMRPHGGWERSLAEAREARNLAVELRLTPRARVAAGIDIPASGAGADVGPDGETGPWVDDQLGPDGRRL